MFSYEIKIHPSCPLNVSCTARPAHLLHKPCQSWEHASHLPKYSCAFKETSVPLVLDTLSPLPFRPEDGKTKGRNILKFTLLAMAFKASLVSWL